MLLSFSATACGVGVVDAQEDENEPASQAQDDSEAAAIGEDEEELVVGQQCGNSVCGKGTYCCNASCGTCAPKGGACTQQVCESPVKVEAEPAFVGQQCGTAVCGKGMYCCNASCNRCAPKGMACTQEACVDPT
ncbi:hypothetical protein [Chondromyces apiculatus]|uniref:Uncharacterized protein n=1 Tax=Chondromyces apiculatus DSM 436 TaxID=1192034 RepID=A0A017TD89_9BACT|nr:hypothetical protein [Chondromyces apiculatus]EYF06790.1 Hypothetical protein CAP_1487 [Chondromyces apiculatus DSM 436]